MRSVAMAPFDVDLFSPPRRPISLRFARRPSLRSGAKFYLPLHVKLSVLCPFVCDLLCTLEIGRRGAGRSSTQRTPLWKVIVIQLSLRERFASPSVRGRAAGRKNEKKPRFDLAKSTGVSHSGGRAKGGWVNAERRKAKARENFFKSKAKPPVQEKEMVVALEGGRFGLRAQGPRFCY